MTPAEREIALRKKAEKKGRVVALDSSAVEAWNQECKEVTEYYEAIALKKEPPKPRTRRTRAA